MVASAHSDAAMVTITKSASGEVQVRWEDGPTKSHASIAVPPPSVAAQVASPGRRVDLTRVVSEPPGVA